MEKVLARVLNAGQLGAGVGCGHVGHLLVRLASPSTAASERTIFNPSLRLRPCARRALDPPPFNRAQVLSEAFLGSVFSLTFVSV